MTLREFIRDLLAHAGDLDEPVVVRVVSRHDLRNGEIGSVDDSRTTVAPVARIGFLGLPVSCIVVEMSDVKMEQEFIDSFPREVVQ